MRKISKTLALMSLLAPLGANALGIGDIRLHSALNQTLNAEIPLVTSGGDDISDLRVTLASPSAFARAGIERHFSLTKLHFTTQQKEDGSYVIKVSSPGAIREPFLNFLIDVYWPQGRLLREFTVLLDPPSSFEETDNSVTDLPEAESYQRPPQPRQRQADESSQAKPRKTARQARAAATPERPAEAVTVTGNQYGPISRNETLWSIAQQFNPDASISQSKMMAALYKANPRAFYKNSINALKAGETITIPDRDSITRLTGAPLATAARRRTQNLTGKSATPAEEIGGESAEAGSQGQLKLLAPTPDKSASGGRGKTGKPGEVTPEIEEMRKRLSDSERQLSEMQRLLTLKDEQIAALQTTTQKQTSQPAPHPQATTIPVVPPQPAVPPASGTESTKPPQPTPPAEPIVPPTQTTPVVPPKPEASPVKPTIQPPPTSKPLTQTVKPPAPKPTAQPAKEEDKGFLDGLVAEPLYLAGGAAGMVLLTLATAVWLKRRRAAMIDDTESILTLNDREKTLQTKRTPVPLDVPSSISEQSTTTRSSFLSEFTPSDFDALGGEMEEVDPISEADVYLAYGRYKQAEELIRSAIGQNPERDECKLKLLEIHYATENAQAFELFAEELAATHKETKPDFWEKVAEMGRELCPDSPLFSNDAKPSSVEAEDDLDSYDYPATSNLAGSAQPDSSLRETKETIAYDFFSPDTTGKDSTEESPHTQFSNVLPFDKTTIGSSATELQDKSLDDILAELGVLSESTSLSREAETLGEKQDLEFEFEEKGETDDYAQEISDDDASPDYLALTDMDEQETKLDLAKAYFDMGDNDAARVILEGVAQQGNDTQKEEAWSLLKRLTRKEVNRR